MGRKVIGSAGEFYRLRVTHVDEGDSPDLEWRDDILYRRPPSESLAEEEVYRVEAVQYDNDDAATTLGAFASMDEAHRWMEAVDEDLAEMTNTEFEESYFPNSEF